MKGIVSLRQASSEQLQRRLVQIGADLVRARGSLHGNVKSPQTENPMFIRKLRRESSDIDDSARKRGEENLSRMIALKAELLKLAIEDAETRRKLDLAVSWGDCVAVLVDFAKSKGFKVV